MTTQKRLAALLLIAALLVSVAACTKAPTPPDSTLGTEGTPGTTPDTSQPPVTQTAKELTDWVTYLTTVNEMETFNILYSQNNKELQVLTNCIDPLITHDNYGNMVPAAAESWSTDDNGKTWVFQIRPGIKWVDYQGNPMADLVASDWLYGLEWVLNFHKNEAKNTSMPTEMIEGAAAYYNYTKDLSEDEGKALGLDVFLSMVGIEARDEHTLVYTCLAPMPYFPTLATYNCLYPAAPALIEQLGIDGFRACTYDNMWYTGPYTITTFVAENEKVLTKNPSYWDESCKRFDTVTYKMVESADVAFQMYQAGQLDHVDLTESNLTTIYNNERNELHDNLVEARPTKYSYQIHLCYDKNQEDGVTADDNWNKAVANEAFRLAWYYGLDATNYLSRTNFINPQKCANYTYTMSNLVSFSDGTEYTARVRELLGIVPDDESFARLDAEKAQAYKVQAMEELAAQGVTFPVRADYYISGSSQTALDTANVLKQVFTDCLGDDFCVLNICTYISSIANEVRNPRKASFYINGWGADYGDPQNYLGQETYGEDNAYYSEAYSKINDATDPQLIATYQHYTEMVNAAAAIVDDMDARYEAYAQAEVYMIEHALVIPWYKNVTWQVTHANDYSKIYALYGCQTNRFVNWVTSEDAYTTAEYDAFAAAYETGASR